MFINGNWIGIHNHPEDLVTGLKKLRRAGQIPKEISIARDIFNKEVRIYTDAGRVQRPLLIVEDDRVKMRKEDETGSTEETLTLTFTFFLVLEQLTSYLFLFPSCSSCSAIVF